MGVGGIGGKREGVIVLGVGMGDGREEGMGVSGNEVVVGGRK